MMIKEMTMMNNIFNRQMPVFISSTFRGMQEEREALIKKTFPKLKVLATQRIVSLTPIDLRWGITEKEATSGKVLELCLNEIERCQPFFIGILGSNYGSILQMKDMKANNMLFSQYEWLREDIENGLSITEIEMQFAVFRRQNRANAFFFIKRNAIIKEKKLENLISKIKTEGLELNLLNSGSTDVNNTNRFYFAYYDNPDDLSIMVENALTKSMESFFSNDKNDDEWARESRAQLAYLNELSDIYVPQSSNTYIVGAINKMEDQYVMITDSDECCCGKSAFIAYWIRNILKENTYNLIYHFIGVGYLGSKPRKILQRLCIEVSSQYGPEYKVDEDEGKEIDYSYLLTRLLLKVKDKKPLFIILDGLQHLSNYDCSKMLEWFPFIPKNVSLIVTTNYHDLTQDVFYNRYGSILRLSSFNSDEEHLFVERYLRKFGKRFSEQQIDSLLSAYSLTKSNQNEIGNILTLKSLLNELVIFGSYEFLDERITYYCEDALSHFYDRMLGRMEKDYGYDTIKLILCMIRYSREGLTESEIKEISHVTIMQFSYIYHAIPYLMTLKNNKYYIDNLTLISAITQRYGKEERKVRQLLVSHFCHSSDFRAIEECLFQYYHLKDFDSLYSNLLDLDVFSHLYDSNGFSELYPYWTALLNSVNRKKYSIDAFASMEIPATVRNAHIIADVGFFAEQVVGDNDSANKLLTISNEMYESIPHTDYAQLASVYTKLGMYEKARITLEKVLGVEELFQKESDRDDMYYLKLLVQKAVLFNKENKTEESIKLLEEALSHIILSKGELCSEVMDIRRKLAAYYVMINDYAKSQEYIEKNINETKKMVGEEHPFMADVFFLYGMFHERFNHKVESVNFYRKALKIYSSWFTESHEKVIETKRRIEKLKTEEDGFRGIIMDSFLNELADSLKSVLNDDVDIEFEDVLDFYEGITDDLYLVNVGMNNGMKEYTYAFRYVHDCYICKNRYIYGPYSNHIYICIDSSGKYLSCGLSFNNLRDAQVHYLMRLTQHYEKYCQYMNI